LNEHPVDFPHNRLEGLGPIVIQACLMEAGKILRITASGVGSPSTYERGEVLELHVHQKLMIRPDILIWTKLQENEKIRETLRQAHMIIFINENSRLILRDALVEFGEKLALFEELFEMTWAQFLGMPIALPSKIIPSNLENFDGNDPKNLVVRIACKLSTAWLDQRMLIQLINVIKARKAKGVINLNAWVGQICG
jgi:hypothetical protein